MLPTILGLGCALIQSARGQSDSKPVSKKGESKQIDQGAMKAASDFLKKVHDGLYDRASVKADIEQTVSMGNQQFQVTGQYLTSGQKLRLEYKIQPEQGIAGSLLEVCDGKELWSMLKVGEATRVTHRDVQQIKAAAAGSRNVPDVVLTAELGLGGLTALLASLERTMVFDAIKEESTDDGPRTVIQGKWKPEIIARWPRSKDDLLPNYVPDLVRLWVDPATMFPVRIAYLKKVIEKDKKVFRAMVSLKFRNVEFDGAVGEQDFTFETPDNVVPEDITRHFLDRMKKIDEDAAAADKSATGAASGKPPQ